MKIRNWLHHAISAYVVWSHRARGMTIGRDCLISRSAKLDLTNPQGIKIGDETAISFNASVLSHDFVNDRHVDTVIGSRCFIGGRSMIMPGVTVGDGSIVGAGSVVYSDVEPNTIVAGNPARVVERGVRLLKYGMKAKASEVSAQLANPVPVAKPGQIPGDKNDFMNELFGKSPLDVPFGDSEIDSFALISIRARIEAHRGGEISDLEWEKVERPLDVLPLVGISNVTSLDNARNSHAEFRRSLEIGMPQMGVNGLSESWLFKEMGDAHWQLICGALGVKSNAIEDQNGNRLYATFTRINLNIGGSLSSFIENDRLQISGQIKRFGAGMFFSDFEITSNDVSAKLSMMSSFARFGVEGDNASLTKGQPILPPDFAIPSFSDTPAFAVGYTNARATEEQSAVFSSDYELVPYHDINGVGLLYFAAYPAIHDICMARFISKGAKLDTISRDVCYFANSGQESTIRFDLERYEERGTEIETVAHLKRKDGKRMATVRAVYSKCW